MPTRTITIVCILAFLNYIGCTSREVITKNTFIEEYVLNGNSNDKDIYVNTIDGSKYFYSAWSYTIVNDSLSGNGKKITSVDKQAYRGKIALSDIASVEQETSDTGNTIILVTAILVAGALIFAVIVAMSASSSAKSCEESVNKSLHSN